MQRRRLILILVITLLGALCCLTIPRQPPEITDSLSEKAVLSYAHEHGLQFGRDIIFTYGPFGFLTSRYFFDHAHGLRMASDVLLCLGVSAGVILLGWRMTLAWRWMLLVTYLFVTANSDPRYDLLIYLGLLCWGLLCFVLEGRLLAVATVCFVLLAAFGILVKLNFLFAAGAGVAALTLDLALRKHLSLAAGCALGLPAVVVLGWVAVGQRIGFLLPAFSHAFSIASGYNQAVGLSGLPILLSLGLVSLVLAAFAVLVRVLKAGSIPIHRRFIVGGWLYSLLFLLWKHSFVRADLFHMTFFFGFIPIFVLALEVFPLREGSPFWLQVPAIGCWVLVLYTLQGWSFANSSVLEPFKAMAINLKTLFAPAEYRREMLAQQETEFRKLELPRLRELVGASTVDVFGQDAVYALHNQMNYHPRPLFQSYMTFNSRLNALNERFCLSAAAPRLVVFNLSALDRKFPPLEDSFSLRELLINYELAGSEGRFLLLQHRTNSRPVLSLLREVVVRPGEPVSLQEFGNSNLWLEVELRPSVRGRLRTFFYKPTNVRLAFWTGKTKLPYRAPASMLAAGFLGSPVLLTREDVEHFYKGGEVLRPDAYSVEIAPVDAPFWRSDVRFRIFKIENPLPHS